MSDSAKPSKAGPATPIDAATVVVGRDTENGIEVLMLRKNSKIHFGGMWVFPGGRVDAEDREGGDGIEAFRTAAVREAEEEAGIRLDSSTLVHLSHWMPPPIRPVRFSTHFFLCAAPEGLSEVAIDHGEITEHAWVAPADALTRRHAGEIEIVTPTFVTLDWLRRFEQIGDALGGIRGAFEFHTHILQTDAGNIAFYAGDVAYDSLDPEAPGPRRRANMLNSGWWWEEHDGQGNGPAPVPVDF
ncbi:MAG: NUDIX domain-containing protein [Pseudomonadota bacterium]